MRCHLFALFDTGSPVSLMPFETFTQFFDSSELIKNNSSFNAINGTPLDIVGSITASIKLDLLPQVITKITFLVMRASSSPSRLILGCDFLSLNDISVLININNKKLKERVQLFSEIASIDVIDYPKDKISDVVSDINIDFDGSVKNQLTKVIKEISDLDVLPIKDDYSVSINLKDTTVFAYSPRRFAYKEKLQIREIIDDLLSRNIISVSNSPYCSRSNACNG